jgi:hypothetical protein
MFRISSGAGRLAVGVVLGLVLGLTTVGGVAVGRAVYDANNAHKVDGKHAVGAKASASKRAGRLVAANSKGKLPVGAIPRETAFGSDYSEDWDTATDPSEALTGASVTVTVDRPATLVATFSAESVCYGGGALTWCGVDLEANGTPMDGESDDAFDSNDNNTETDSSWETHSVTRTLSVEPGTYNVTVDFGPKFGDGTFELDDWNLVVVGYM